MTAKPNHTMIEGTVRAICPDAGGYGTNVEVEVSHNLSPTKDADFLKPNAGDRVVLFTPNAPAAEIGKKVRIHARLLAGPFGERSIIESLELLPGEH